MSKKRSPIVWFGGKSILLKHIIPLIHAIQHKVYIEVFGGGGAVLFAKRRSNMEIYNDIDQGLYNFMTVISDPDTYDEFYRRVQPLQVCRQLYEEYRDGWRDEPRPVQRAVMWFVMIRQGMSGLVGLAWAMSTTVSTNVSTRCLLWMSAIKYLPECHKRLRMVQIENREWEKILNTYDSEDSLFYLDPPYIHETRTGNNEYYHEMTNENHEALVEAMLALKGSAILSGYQHSIYKPLEDAGWVRKDYVVPCQAAIKSRHNKLQGKGALDKQKRVESLWIKPHTTGEGLFKHHE